MTEMMEPVEVKLNRAQRRALLKQVRREWRKGTRWWRRTWRGVHSQQGIAAIVKSQQEGRR